MLTDFMRTVCTAAVRTIPAALLVAGLASTNSAHAGALEKAKAAGQLTAVTEMQFAPFDMVVDGKYEGVNKDILDQIGKELGVKMNYVDLPWTSVLPGLESGKFDS